MDLLLMIIFMIPALAVYGWIRDITPERIKRHCATDLYRPYFEEKGLTYTRRPNDLGKANSDRLSESNDLYRKLREDKMLSAQIEDKVAEYLHPRRKVIGWIALLGTMVLLGAALGVINMTLSESQIQNSPGGILALYSDYFVAVGVAVSFLAGGGAVKLADRWHQKRSVSS